MRAAPWAGGLLDLLLPTGCLACGTWIPGGERASIVCGGCLARLPVAPWPRCPRCHHPRGTGRGDEPACRMCRAWPDTLAHARHAHLLAPPADTLVHALKYEGWRELTPIMGRAMAKVPLPPVLPGGRRVVVPVPTTRERVRRRGYNQAHLLAADVAERLGLDLVDGLARTRGGATQVALHPSERRANVRGAFQAREEALPGLQGAHVLLVDDVLTTGATAVAAAAELALAGVSEVTLLTYARALPFLRSTGR
ncbi:MAG TPA: phosphoribosyltransferase family protein [Longimicrobiales bacterium]|nr:phosphoribosyltransferase family protein [Longimicrobiales bacterium]